MTNLAAVENKGLKLQPVIKRSLETLIFLSQEMRLM